MKKLAIFLITGLLLFTINVKAASNCSYQEQAELNSKAANVKVSYEVVEETIGTEDFYVNSFFKISITNISEEFYVVVQNSHNKNNKTTYRYSDAIDGIITFNWTYAEDLTNFTIQIYTSSSTKCANERIKTLYLTTPRYNEYSDREICQIESDFYLCQEYVTFSKINSATFEKKLNEYYKGEINESGETPKESFNEETFMDNILGFINNYKWYIISGGLLIIVIIVAINRFKTKKQRELGL